MTGDYICPICGAYWCQSVRCRFQQEIERKEMTTMPKRPWPQRHVPRFEPESLPEPASEAEVALVEATPKEALEEFLTDYLGDAVFAKRFADCIDMIKRKNADYTQGVEKRDRIAAFRRIGGDISVPMPKVWAIFAQKHWGAVMKYVKDGTTESEPIDGRINDLINYFVLLGAIIDDMEGR